MIWISNCELLFNNYLIVLVDADGLSRRSEERCLIFRKEFHKADAYATTMSLAYDIHDGQLSTKKREIKIFTQSTRRIVPKGTITGYTLL